MHGNAHWTPQRLAWSALLMAWAEQPQLTERFDAVTECLQAACPHWKLGGSYQGWVDAQQREQSRIIPAVVGRLRQQMRELNVGRRLARWDAFGVDGSKISCPRTRENQAALGDVGKPEGIPQMSLTAVMHLATGLPWDFRTGPGTDSERGHLRQMLPGLPADSLLVADAGFIGYDLCREMLRREQHFLLRVGGNIHLLQELGYRQEIAGKTVYLWPVDQQQRNQSPLKLRLILLQDDDKQPVYLVTSVLDAAELTDAEGSVIYGRRWGIEVQFRTLKQTLEHHTVRSRTPQNCYLETAWAYLGVWLLELMTLNEIIQAGGDPQKRSPAQARNAIRRSIRNASPQRRCRTPLLTVLASCQTDSYQRRGPKASRSYPRKKQHKPPGPPNIKLPTQQQLQKAKQLTPITLRI